jgi:hypothetical protein
MTPMPTSFRANEPWWPLVAICIVGIFLLVGPPVGGVASWAVILLTTRPNTFAWHLLAGFVLNSYWVGAPFALASGVLHAIAALRFRRYSVAVPFVSSALVVVLGVDCLSTFKPRIKPRASNSYRGFCSTDLRR